MNVGTPKTETIILSGQIGLCYEPWTWSRLVGESNIKPAVI